MEQNTKRSARFVEYIRDQKTLIGWICKIMQVTFSGRKMKQGPEVGEAYL
jgi:hypothetical protein